MADASVIAAPFDASFQTGFLMNALRFCLVAALLAAACALHAQTGSRITEPSTSPPSRWQGDKDQLDAALRARALTVTDPRGLWMAGQLDAGDPGARVTAYAQARVAAPTEMVYLTSLALACLEPVQPRWPECDATDRLADWATRDLDNGVPMLMLADRARQRNNATAMIAFLDEAAVRPRFDDYWAKGALLLWEEVRALPVPVEPAAKAELASAYGVAQSASVANAIQALCRDASKAGENVRTACNAAGAAAAQRAATWSLRAAGARLAERSADAGPAQAAALQRLADIQRRAFECAEAGNPIALALESADPAARARAVSEWERRLVQDAQLGEVAACARAAAPAKG
jgi:hypothetical protein